MTSENTGARSLEALHEAIIRNWPEHAKAIRQNFDGCSPTAQAHAAETADLILRIASDDLDRRVQGYRWMCDMILEEEYFFRTQGRYRCTSFEEAVREVYSKPEIMGPYMDGLLVSQAIWSNHIIATDFYIHSFLNQRKPGSKHVEIGPGHGLLLYYAARDGQVVEGWDVSEDSLQHCAACSEKLGFSDRLRLEKHNIFEGAGREGFDSVVVSEVLEHLEAPGDAVKVIRDLLTPAGRAFINVPVNGPTVDHISLFRSPEEVVAMVAQAGMTVVDMIAAPSAGYSEEKARRRTATISTCIIATR